MFIICVYRPPNSDNVFVDNITCVLKKLHDTGANNILMLGDLNLPGVEWDSFMSPHILMYNLRFCIEKEVYVMYVIFFNCAKYFCQKMYFCAILCTQDPSTKPVSLS